MPNDILPRPFHFAFAGATAAYAALVLSQPKDAEALHQILEIAFGNFIIARFVENDGWNVFNIFTSGLYFLQFRHPSPFLLDAIDASRLAAWIATALPIISNRPTTPRGYEKFRLPISTLCAAFAFICLLSKPFIPVDPGFAIATITGYLHLVSQNRNVHFYALATAFLAMKVNLQLALFAQTILFLYTHQAYLDRAWQSLSSLQQKWAPHYHRIKDGPFWIGLLGALVILTMPLDRTSKFVAHVTLFILLSLNFIKEHLPSFILPTQESFIKAHALFTGLFAKLFITITLLSSFPNGFLKLIPLAMFLIGSIQDLHYFNLPQIQPQQWFNLVSYPLHLFLNLSRIIIAFMAGVRTESNARALYHGVSNTILVLYGYDHNPIRASVLNTLTVVTDVFQYMPLIKSSHVANWVAIIDAFLHLIMTHGIPRATGVSLHEALRFSTFYISISSLLFAGASWYLSGDSGFYCALSAIAVSMTHVLTRHPALRLLSFMSVLLSTDVDRPNTVIAPVLGIVSVSCAAIDRFFRPAVPQAAAPAAENNHQAAPER